MPLPAITQADPFLKLGLRPIAVAASLVAIAALTTLVTVVALSGSDTLAAVALVLAILAFVVQIVVFIADLYISNRRDAEAQSLYSDTKSLLTRIETVTAGTSDMVSVQLGKLIDGLLIGTKPPVNYRGEPTGDDGRFEQLQGALIAARNEAATQFAGLRQQGAARATLIRTWPSEAVLRQLIADGVQGLPAECFPLFDILAMDLIASYDRGLPEGRVMDMPMYREASIALQSRGFAKQEDAALVLTLKGLLAASLIASYDPIPPHVVELWPELHDIRGRSQH
ncbi:hypothetical protein E3T55_18750 [Cryobacterium frigoriphilum]|uniref:Uncharacterized protein n=1 Tax=Cryobacterium frigoriphilum TaxID=1259150 RepID=A0A4R8ZTY8_9MICO|nr:hypothetical protein [Cryobacterium frigoriphilum]TFD45376.1 hypothetical protein E3T55_18750 [Cryobacterium frigoriphilum]